MLDSKSKIDLSKYLLSKAENDIENAKILLSLNKYEASINRSYYVIFSCMRAILALDVIEFKKHSAIISYFSKEYIKTGIFNKKYSNVVREAFLYRQKSDYEYFYIASKEDAINQYNNAKEFLEGVKKYLDERLKKES